MIDNRLIASLLAAATLSVAAQNVTLQRFQSRNLPIETLTENIISLNPATMWWLDSVAISSASATYNFKDADRPEMEQLGTGHNLFSLGAQSFMPINSRIKVWGGAKYRTGQLRNLRWTDCIDYQFVAPYVMGDAVGGDLTTRCYDFDGGFAGKSGRWTYGAGVSYRAEIAWRNVDPRIKTIVSDLALNFGASYILGSHYAVGLDAAIKVYNQNCDVDFYNPINDINTFTLTGLGTYYRRFMGNTNKNSGYGAFGWKYGVQLIPTDRCGFLAIAEYSSYRVEQQLRNFNNITLGFTDNKIIEGRLGYAANIHNVRLLPFISAQLHNRRGTENLFGTAIGASYDKIGSRRSYSHKVTTFGAELPVELNFGGNYLTISPSASYSVDDEKFISPRRQLKATRPVLGLNVDYSLNISDLWVVDIRGRYTHLDAKAKTCILSDLDFASPLGELVTDNFEMLTTSANSFAAQLQLSRDVKGKVVTLSLSGIYVRYANRAVTRGVDFSFSITF